MKDSNERNSAKKPQYLWLGIMAVLFSVLIVVLAVVTANRNNAVEGKKTSEKTPASEQTSEEASETADPTGGLDEDEYASPIAVVNVMNNYGFYFNKTLGTYYLHEGIDFSASVGDEVCAIADGTVEGIYTSDVLTGTQIVLTHADGLTSLYQGVEAKDGLSVGDTVKKGDVIGAVAEATGVEYKDGAHLHFELKQNGTSVDPNAYLTWEEK